MPNLLNFIIDKFADTFGIEPGFSSMPTEPSSQKPPPIPPQTVTIPSDLPAKQHVLPGKVRIPRNEGSPNLLALVQTPPPPSLLTRELSESDSELPTPDQNSPLPGVRRISLSGYTPYDRGIRTPGNCCILEALQSPKHRRGSSAKIILSDCQPEDKQSESRRSSLTS